MRTISISVSRVTAVRMTSNPSGSDSGIGNTVLSGQFIDYFVQLTVLFFIVEDKTFEITVLERRPCLNCNIVKTSVL